MTKSSNGFRFDITDDSRNLPSLAICPLGSCSCRDPPRGTKTSGVSSRPSRTPARTRAPGRTLLPPVSASPSPDGRHNHCRPQTSTATPLRRRSSVTSLAHRAHSTSHHHNVRKSPHRRSPVERAPRETVPWASSREGIVSSGSSRISTGDGHVSGARGMCAPTKRPKLDLSARTRHRGALLERWLAQFWNEARV